MSDDRDAMATASPTAVVESHTSAPPEPARTRYRVGEPLPLVLTLKDLESVLNLSAATIWDLYKAGSFNFALLQPAAGKRPRFSGKQIQAWVDREPVEAIVQDTLTSTRHYFGRRKR